MTTVTLEFNGDYDSPHAYHTDSLTRIMYRVTIDNDTDGESPRDWCNVSTMVCEHRRYNLGDSDGRDKAIAAVRESRDYRATWEDGTARDCYTFAKDGETHDVLDLHQPQDLWQAVQWCSDIVSQPLYLYDHSGISISTGGFSCPWDSGQVGFAFVTLAALRECTMKPRAVWTKRNRQWAIDCINGECETYDQYLRGDVYGYQVEVSPLDDYESADWEHVDSCYGFFGNHAESGLIDQAIDAIAADIETRRKARNGALARLIRNHVPLHLRHALLLESVA